MREPLRFECVNCLTEWDDPFCDSCGADLTRHPLIPEQRVPGVRSAAELRRITRDYGSEAALMVATHDALFAALAAEHRPGGYQDDAEFSVRVPDEVAMVRQIRDADHHDLQRLK